MVKLDLLVIGGGTAGGYAASTARRSLDAVGVVERGQVGGDCIFHACIPTKAMVHAARTYKRMKGAGFYGLPTLSDGAYYRNVKAFKDRIVAGIGTGRDERLAGAGIRLFKGSARFTSPHGVSVGDELIEADRIVIATGSEPSVPPIPGLRETGYITSIEALELEKVPQTLAIVGGGPIGVEFAQVFSAFGCKVHIYEALGRVLSGEDEEISNAMVGFFARQGISVSAPVRVTGVGRSDTWKLVTVKSVDGQERTDEYEEILVATGRKPAIDDLDLQAAGIEADRRGVKVNGRLETNLPHVWAAGDATGTFAFTLIAWQQGEVAGLNASGSDKKQLDYRVLPRATFCDPEVASVGLTEKQARDQGYAVKTGRYDYANLTRAIVSDETGGFIKIVAEENSGRILGGHIVGVEASSLIHEIAVAMAKDLTVDDVGGTFHSYPTLSEGVRYACQTIV